MTLSSVPKKVKEVVRLTGAELPSSASGTFTSPASNPNGTKANSARSQGRRKKKKRQYPFCSIFHKLVLIESESISTTVSI